MKKYKISNNRCKYCGGMISWDEYPNQKWPIHVDVNGFKIGMGTCPKFNMGFQTNNPKKLSKVPISHSIKSKKSINLKPYLGHIIATFSVICIVVSLCLLGVIFSALNTNNYHYPHNPYDIPDDPDNEIEEPFYWEIDGEGNATLVVDGDTYYFDGESGSVDEYVRLADIDTPESGDNGYQEAKDYLTSLVHMKWVYLDIDDITGTDPYGRIVGITYVRHNSTHLLNVNKALIESGHASIWDFDNNEFNPNEWPLYVFYI